jgi:hypothetical protein
MNSYSYAIGKFDPTIVVGDIHGCYDEFQELCRLVKFGARDALVTVGDFLDRGPDSWKVASFFRDVPNAFSVLGNHERRVAGTIRGCPYQKLDPDKTRAGEPVSADAAKHQQFCWIRMQCKKMAACGCWARCLLQPVLHACILSGIEFLRRRGFRRLCASIDYEGLPLWETQVLSPSPAAARPCYLENPFQGKGDFASRGNNQGRKPYGAGARSHSG